MIFGYFHIFHFTECFPRAPPRLATVTPKPRAWRILDPVLHDLFFVRLLELTQCVTPAVHTRVEPLHRLKQNRGTLGPSSCDIRDDFVTDGWANEGCMEVGCKAVSSFQPYIETALNPRWYKK